MTAADRRLVKGEIIAVGTELLLGHVINSNAAEISKIASAYGIGIYRHTAVGDNMGRIRKVLGEAISRSDIIFVSGGLGPTGDDITKEAVAEELGMQMEYFHTEMQKIESFFDKRGITMPANNKKQAMFPREATILDNPNGTAPGMLITLENGKVVVVLPGPPLEMKHMLQEKAMPLLSAQLYSGSVIKSKNIRLWGIGESKADELLDDLFQRSTNPSLAYLFEPGQIIIRITARSEEEAYADAMIETMEKEVRERVGEYVFATGEGDVIDYVADKLILAKHTLAVAESCTGGMIASLITAKPGSSRFFDRGFITYSNKAKLEMLGVTEDIIEQFGAVSEECAIAMAKGALAESGCDIALAVTGIAGPDGGSEDKPVGLVYIAIADNGAAYAKSYLVPGERNKIRTFTAYTALHMLRQRLEELEQVKK